jgi:5-formyltetrahydrofolate cyclo-ligase
MLTKAELRKRILDWRNSLSEDEVRARSAQIAQKLLRSTEYQKADTLMVYSAFGSEAGLGEIIKDAWSQGKGLLFPKVHRAEKRMYPYIVKDETHLSPGIWGILEPNEQAVRWTGKPRIDLVIIPGLAFDSEGHRLGYGGGYYDRWLAELEHYQQRPRLVAVAFREQIVDEVPFGSHDVLVDQWITD